MKLPFEVGGRNFEVRGGVMQDGSFRAEVFEAGQNGRRLTLGAGMINSDVLADMPEGDRPEAARAVMTAIQTAVEQSFEQPE